MRQPIKFLPYFKSTIWGGDEISRFKGISLNCKDIGESWELSAVPGCESIVADGNDCGMTLNNLVEKYKDELVGKHVYERYGNNFPLLVKFIDAKDDLSLQVHPDDKLAKQRHNCFGKTEMWYILDSKKNAKIHTGLNRSINAEEYEKRVSNHTLMDVVASYDSAPGDLFFLPAGRLHAIGTGNFLVEIQQSSNITYRVDDYNRRDANGNLRELHTELAKDAIDFTCLPSYKSEVQRIDSTTESLVKCDYFQVNKITIQGEESVRNNEDSFMGLVCIEGDGKLKVDGISTPVHQGETLLLPAHVDEFDVEGNLALLTIVIPSLASDQPKAEKTN